MSISFLHSGECGDIIASLSVVKDICNKNNCKAHFIIDTQYHGLNKKFKSANIIYAQTHSSGTKMNTNFYEFLKPLIASQSYIELVKEYEETDNIDIDLNMFRQMYLTSDINILYAHQYVNNIDVHDDAGWIDVPKTNIYDKDSLLVCRSLRYQSSSSFLIKYISETNKNIKFMGLDSEYIDFTNLIKKTCKTFIYK